MVVGNAQHNLPYFWAFNVRVNYPLIGCSGAWMKIINLECGSGSGVIFHFAGTPAPFDGKSTSFPISIALRRTGFGKVSVSRHPLCFSDLMVKARNLVATSDEAAKSPSIRLKGFESREQEFQGQAGQPVVLFGTNSAKPYLSHMHA